jgi:hypothetical protein
LEGRERVELVSSDATELRPRICEVARDRGWTLWELHREKASLEQLFRTLTTIPELPGEDPAVEGGIAAWGSAGAPGDGDGPGSRGGPGGGDGPGPDDGPGFDDGSGSAAGSGSDDVRSGGDR